MPRCRGALVSEGLCCMSVGLPFAPCLAAEHHLMRPCLSNNSCVSNIFDSIKFR